MRFSLAPLAFAAATLLSGCAGMAFGPNGAPMGTLYTGAQTTSDVSANNLGAKRGESCAMSILGLVTTGDASVTTAAKAGGITKVSHVDHETTNIIGVYAKFCTQVVGD
jgi:hypothetical protein